MEDKWHKFIPKSHLFTLKIGQINDELNTRENITMRSLVKAFFPSFISLLRLYISSYFFFLLSVLLSLPLIFLAAVITSLL